MATRKKIKVIYKSLKSVWGMGYPEENIIEVHSKLKGKKLLEILIHESLHVLYPQFTEEEIVAKSIILTNTLWNEGYRRIDNDNDVPLQDGSK